MEIKKVYNKVKGYLLDEVGNMALPGNPKYDPSGKRWRVPVLCATEKGIFITGEIILDENLKFIKIPSMKQMLKILKVEMKQVPFLVYAEADELKKKGVEAVTI